MTTIKITRLTDDFDCECCGGNWAEGFKVLIDGVPFGDYTPLAHCFGGTDYYLYDVLKDVLEHLGHEVRGEMGMFTGREELE